MSGPLRQIQLEAIRYRAGAPGGNIGLAKEDRAWLLHEYDALRNAVLVVLTAVAGGADAYEVRPELDALAEVAGLPSAAEIRRAR